MKSHIPPIFLICCAILLCGCSTPRARMSGGWVGAEGIASYRLGASPDYPVGTLYREADEETLMIGDLLWREKSTTEAEVLQEYAKWHLRQQTEEPLNIYGKASLFRESLIPGIPKNIDRLNMVARGRKVEYLNDLLLLESFLNNADYPDTRLESFRAQMTADAKGSYFVTTLRETCADLVLELHFKDEPSQEEIEACKAFLAQRIAREAGARRRTAVYSPQERTLRVEYTGKMALRSRSVRIIANKSGEMRLGEIVRQ